MKESIKYLLIYIIIQIIVIVPLMIYLLSTGGDMELIKSSETMGVLMLLANLLTIGYLCGVSKIGRERSCWSIVSGKYMVLTTLVVFSLIWLSSLLITYLGLPNIMDDDLQALASTWYGVLHIAVLGPIGEEFLFRGGGNESSIEVLQSVGLNSYFGVDLWGDSSQSRSDARSFTFGLSVCLDVLQDC